MGGCLLLALHRANAFDCINPDNLQDALRRAGVPESFLQMISSMIRCRRCYVEDGGICFELHDQSPGISQGCTLSPLLFIVAMSVLLHDAVTMLDPVVADLYASGKLADIVYAGNTLLIGVSDSHLEEYLAAVCEAGKRMWHGTPFRQIPISVNGWLL